MKNKTKQSAYQLIFLIGNIASGKTTAMHLLAEKLHLKTIDADSLFQTTDPFREKYLQEPKRFAFTNELWLTTQRALIMKKSLAAKQQKYILVDSGLLMSWVYTYSHLLTKNILLEEWLLYETLYNLLAKDILKNSQIIYLDYSVDTLLKRIKQRGRDYELQYYSAKYLKQIQSGLEALVAMVKKEKSKILTIREKEISDFINNQKKQKLFLAKITKFIY